MRDNANVAIEGRGVRLVPYCARHVLKYDICMHVCEKRDDCVSKLCGSACADVVKCWTYTATGCAAPLYQPLSMSLCSFLMQDMRECARLVAAHFTERVVLCTRCALCFSVAGMHGRAADLSFTRHIGLIRCRVRHVDIIPV